MCCGVCKHVCLPQSITLPCPALRVQDDLLKVYSDIYVELVAKNPRLKVHEPITMEQFKVRMDSHMRSLPYFDTKHK